MTGEGNGADEGEEVAGADADEEIAGRRFRLAL